MEQIVIRVKDKHKAQALVNFLETLDFVENVTDTSKTETATERAVQDADFFSLAGLWAGRDVTLATIRQKAWPSRS
jgi:hypothetical protein